MSKNNLKELIEIIEDYGKRHIESLIKLKTIFNPVFSDDFCYPFTPEILAKLTKELEKKLKESKTESSTHKENKKYLYIITTKEELTAKFKNTKKDLEELKIKFPQINSENFKLQTSETKYLYIGVSQNILKRLREHLGKAVSPSTYALHLGDWFEGKIHVDVYETAEKTTCLYEEYLWLKYRPLLGQYEGYLKKYIDTE